MKAILEVLEQKFNGQFIVESGVIDGQPHIKFPAKSSDFGDVYIRAEDVNSYRLEVGNFKHFHFDIDKTFEYFSLTDMISFLELLFADHIICCHCNDNFIGHFHEDEYDDDDFFYCWSGIYKPARKPLVKYKHWYTGSHDYSDDLGKNGFELDEEDELIVNVARVYAIDEAAFTPLHRQKIDEIIRLMAQTSPYRYHFPYKFWDGFEPGCFVEEGDKGLWYSFEPVGLQI